MVALLVILALIVVAGLVAVSIYNRLVAARNAVDSAWANIDVALTRRADLIPNLVETVKGYMNHEAETLKAVTEARSALHSASSPAEAAAADIMLTQALGRLFAVAEAYPDLKASANFTQLQSELAETENIIAGARQTYNAETMRYNTYREKFPAILLASLFGFSPREYFEADEASRQAPKASF